MLKFII